MNELSECYKIFRENKGHLLSMGNNQFQLHYIKDKFNYPNIGKIFVFDDIYYCEEYYRRLYKKDRIYTIYECEGENVNRIPSTKVIHIATYCKNIKYSMFLYWEKIYDLQGITMSEAETIVNSELVNAPIGTYVCDAIKLIEEIKV